MTGWAARALTQSLEDKEEVEAKKNITSAISAKWEDTKAELWTERHRLLWQYQLSKANNRPLLVVVLPVSRGCGVQVVPAARFESN